MRKQPIYILFLFVFFAACKKLPKETHRGRNMMACYVNGEKWKADGGFWPGTSASYIGNTGGSITHSPSVVKSNYFYIFGVDKKRIYESKKKEKGDIYISIPIFNGVGEYLLDPRSFKISGGIKISNGAKYTIEGGWNFHTDSIYNGEVNIKYYEEGKVCAGTFSFEAINQKGEIVKITDGRFDIGTFDY